jgi:hypothetical protein
MSMCGNRVEELESRVNELEASVEGLTDELVECKVRLRELENAVDTDLGFSADDSEASSDSAADHGPTGAAPAGRQGPADTHKAEADKTEDNREESEADSETDIIVA